MLSAPVTDIPTLRSQWRQALSELPSTPDNIPAFFLAHGQLMVIWPKGVDPPTSGRMGNLYSWCGREGPLGSFLDDLGPVLLEKYKPKGIVVFSAHWDTEGERRVSDYGDENPLLMDFYGFMPQMYETQFKSKGDKALTERIIDKFQRAGMPASALPRTESRGRDGRPPTATPPPSGTALGAGLDHGVFVPFIRMFGNTMPDGLPVVEVSIDSSFDPRLHMAIGEAVSSLRQEGYLIIAGGLVVHTFEDDLSGFNPFTAKPILKEFDQAVRDAVAVSDPEQRRKALIGLTHHPGFRAAHPQEDHFVPFDVPNVPSSRTNVPAPVSNVRGLVQAWHDRALRAQAKSRSIPVAREWADRYVSAPENPLLDASQGAPNSPPHQILRDALSSVATSDEAHRYGDILGEYKLRELLRSEMELVYGQGPGSLDLKTEDIGLTAGCNMAFYAAIMAIACQGDEVVLPCPWYFNHQMTLQMNGIQIIPLPAYPENNFIPTIKDAESLIITSLTKAIVLVTPNNPTGAVYPPSTIRAFAQFAHARGIALIIDETYRDFVLDEHGEPSAPHSLFSATGDDEYENLGFPWRETVVHLFSFSKSYAIPGHRLGAIVGAPEFLRQVATVLDCIQICPPKPIQLALSQALDLTPPSDPSSTNHHKLAVISALRPHIIKTARSLEARRKLVKECFADTQTIRVSSGGAGYFVFIRVGSGAREKCRTLAEKHGVVLLPAGFFAPVINHARQHDPFHAHLYKHYLELEAWVRFSVANLSEDEIREAARRIRSWIESDSESLGVSGLKLE